MTSSLEQLVSVIRELQSARGRVIVGVVGEPGSGKSTLTKALVQQLGSSSAVVPMDGFHLSNDELARLGRAERKGAVDTFDVAGYVNLLQRLRDRREPVVYAPDYVRTYEEAIAASIPVPSEVDVVITEGNYLLHSGGGWEDVKPLLDYVAYLDCNSNDRIQRLVQRHREFGKSMEQAVLWANGSDEQNARLIRDTRASANLTINLGELPGP